MERPICATCGTRFGRGQVPEICPICADERQYVPASGQRWISAEALSHGHQNAWRQHEPGLFGIGTVPAFAIGQRALLVRTPHGNVLWDCISLLDEVTVALVEALGGLAAIAISHPHYYSSMADWSAAFGAPVWLHEADAAYVMQPGPHLRFWAGEAHELLPGLTLIHAPGHFAGGAMLHWAAGAAGRGCLLSGDIYQVGPDRRVSFMRSYPNLIPLPAGAVRLLAERTAGFAYDSIYGAWWDRVIPSGAKDVVAASVARYLAAIAG